MGAWGTGEERHLHQLGAGIQLLPVFFTSCTCISELGMRRGRNPVVINKTILPLSQKWWPVLR